MQNFLIRDKLLILSLVTCFTLIYTFVGIQKHVQFQTFAWDTAVFVQQLYLLTNFQHPYSSLLNVHILSDHFQITFLSFGSLFYYLWRDPKVLFLFQATFACFSAIPLFYISKLILKETKLKKTEVNLLSLILCFTYLSSVSFQGMMTDEFHNEPLVALPLLLMFYLHLSKKNILFFVSVIFVLLTKEIFGLIIAIFGIYIILTSHEIKKGIITLILGLLTFYFLLFILMPNLSLTDQYIHFAAGNRPTDIINKITNDPILIFTEFINHPDKQKTIISSLFSFSFLPLLSPINLIMPLSSLALRFFDDSTPRLYQFNNHYAVPYISFLAVSSIFGLKKLIEILNKFKIPLQKIFLFLIIIILGFSFFQTLIFKGSLNSIFKKDFYEPKSWQKDTYDLIKQVPKNSIIASQNSLLPHLSEREEFYLLPKFEEDTEYIVLDLEDGPNKFSPISLEQTQELMDQVILKNQFEIIWQQNKAVLLKRIR